MAEEEEEEEEVVEEEGKKNKQFIQQEESHLQDLRWQPAGAPAVRFTAHTHWCACQRVVVTTHMTILRR